MDTVVFGMAVFDLATPAVQNPGMLNPRERAIEAVVETHGLHGALHALVEVCYRKAADLDRFDPLGRKGENWKLIGRRLTAIEAEAAALDV